MLIVENTITVPELKLLAENLLGDLVKGVVDIENEILIIDAELHADLEAFLLSNNSNQEFLWGINLYPDIEGDDFIEFDSMINIRPRQGNRSRSVENVDYQKKIKKIVNSKIAR